MKIKILSLIILTGIICSFTMQAKKKIIFFGDSITEQGIGPEGYITKLRQTFEQQNFDKNYELIGAGIGGNKVYDLYLRMEDDVLAKNPDAVVIWIGVNDVWHKKSMGTGTDPDKFVKFYDAIIKKLKDRNIAVYLCTPAAIGEKWDCTNELDGDLNKYAAIVRNIAKTNSCSLIDLRQSFLDYWKANNPDNREKGVLTVDGVHLNATGNAFVAKKMFDALNKNFIRP
ncbi:MAG: SGNH/GDSL hydrolase family protein [Flavisolibacter sp.]|jgi:lysophospholipase L1-like esterase